MTFGRRFVRVHLKTGETLSGFLRRGSYPGHYVLDVPRMHESATATHPLKGNVAIPRENVLFFQRLAAVEAES